jgi:hypothetical protein
MRNPATMNTVCPVCGDPIADERPPVDFAPQYQQHQQEDRPQLSFRVCCDQCAQRAAADAQRYRTAAEANALAPER